MNNINQSLSIQDAPPPFLPTEIWMQIFPYLEPETLAAFSQTDKIFYDCVCSSSLEQVWKGHLFERFPTSVEKFQARSNGFRKLFVDWSKKTVVLKQAICFFEKETLDQIDSSTGCSFCKSIIEACDLKFSIDKKIKELVFHYLNIFEIKGRNKTEPVYGEVSYLLGECFSEEIGVEEDAKSAFQYYELAANRGHLEAQNQVGLYYLRGEGGIEKDEPKAFNLFVQAAEKGNISARYQLGICYKSGSGTVEDKTKAFEHFKLAADQGYEMAQNQVGLFYREGMGTEKNLPESFNYYKLAADQGHSVAQTEVGSCYINGTGIEKNLSEGIRYLKLAINGTGGAKARNQLGYCYLNGIGVEKDLSQAFTLFGWGLKFGISTSQYNVGLCYLDGLGVERELSLARYYFQLAASQGHVDAMERLKLCQDTKKRKDVEDNSLEESPKKQKHPKK